MILLKMECEIGSSKMRTPSFRNESGKFPDLLRSTSVASEVDFLSRWSSAQPDKLLG
ncbi:hypothetical protein TIFTF001_016303 [Ficus carica]|uniref:Uncharacterized protein n=1 Tax=Ficus carica TaxID=3494 RepID=A0AA88AT77_FICCA|nr:hypothetical protein TIFTF001_016303 [Ficus carica]